MDQEFSSAATHNGFRWDESDAYLFDIDGTLLNTRDGVHYNAFRNAITNIYGVDASIDGVPVHGNTDIGVLRAVTRHRGVSDETFSVKLPTALQSMREEVALRAHLIEADLCPSIADLLEKLHAAGKLLGVASGNLESIGWAKLEKAGVRHYFGFGAFSDQRELREDVVRHGVAQARQRLGERATVCVVGDTPADIRAARAVGVPVIAVATGIFPKAELEALSPDLCIGCCTELFQAA